MTQVLNGLAAGDQIIVGNVGVLGRGMEVRVMSTEQQPGRTTGSGLDAGPPAANSGDGRTAPAGGARATARADSVKSR